MLHASCVYWAASSNSDAWLYVVSHTLYALLLQAKDVTHLWELGGGTFLSKLVEVSITADTIRLAKIF